MYCENCGKKLEEHYLYCSECGFKVNKIISDNSKKHSNKILWIVLGCVFGIPVLLFIIGCFLSFYIIIDNTNYSIEDDNLSEYYDYEKLNNSYFYNSGNNDIIKID